jgi:hypothetical protein
MLNQQGAHGKSLICTRTTGPLSRQYPTLRGMHTLYMACIPCTAKEARHS